MSGIGVHRGRIRKCMIWSRVRISASAVGSTVLKSVYVSKNRSSRSSRSCRIGLRDRDRDFWIPINVTPAFRATRGSHFLAVVARLKPDATLQGASDEMTAIANRLKVEHPDENRYTGAVV